MNKKGSKVQVLVGISLAVLLPCLTQAGAPNDMSVGEIDAILKFCIKTNPELEKNARSLQALLTGQAVPGARASAQYQQGYDLVSDALANANQVQVSANCTAGLTERKSPEARHGHWRERESLALAGAAPNAKKLGVAEGVVNYCGPIDPAATDRLGQMIKQLVQGASGQQLAEVRNSDEYRKAYDSVVNSAGKIAPRNAAQFCAENSMQRK